MTDKTGHATFGQTLREKRLAKGFSLRQFALNAGVSPTYLSGVEQDKVAPPTADRVTRMAELLGENIDEWTALAGRVAPDLIEIIHESPVAIAELLRSVRGLTLDQLRRLRDEAESMKGGEN